MPSDSLKAARKQLVEKHASLSAELIEVEKALRLVEEALGLLNSGSQTSIPPSEDVGVTESNAVGSLTNANGLDKAHRSRSGRRAQAKTGSISSPRQWFARAVFPKLVSQVLRQGGGKVKTGELISNLAKARGLAFNSDTEAKQFKYAVLAQLKAHKDRGLLKTVGRPKGTQERTWTLAKSRKLSQTASGR
jgi:hypothetical protein